jgi:hypothetical protein
VSDTFWFSFASFVLTFGLLTGSHTLLADNKTFCATENHSLSYDLPFQVASGKMEWSDFSVAEQSTALEWLTHSSPMGRFLRSFYLPKNNPIFSQLNPEVLKLLYKMNTPGSNSNCYWTSLFAKNLVPLPERFMDLPEYLSILNSQFTKVAEGDLSPGDIIRLRRVRGGMELHSVIYIGDWGPTHYHVVLTKNGSSDGPYLLMGLDELKTYVYPSAYIAGVYRSRANPICLTETN